MSLPFTAGSKVRFPFVELFRIAESPLTIRLAQNAERFRPRRFRVIPKNTNDFRQHPPKPRILCLLAKNRSRPSHGHSPARFIPRIL